MSLRRLASWHRDSPVPDSCLAETCGLSGASYSALVTFPGVHLGVQVASPRLRAGNRASAGLAADGRRSRSRSWRLGDAQRRPGRDRLSFAWGHQAYDVVARRVCGDAISGSPKPQRAGEATGHPPSWFLRAAVNYATTATLNMRPRGTTGNPQPLEVPITECEGASHRLP